MIKIINHFFNSFNLVLTEWNFAACYTKILISLFCEKIPLLNNIFRRKNSIWNIIIDSFGDKIVEEVGGFSKEKGYSKTVCYKCLQGGSVTRERIQKSLITKKLHELSTNRRDRFMNNNIQNNGLTKCLLLIVPFYKNI